MDKNKAKELSNILLAYSQGKTIQRELNNSEWQDIKELKGEDIKQATIKLMGDYLNLRIKPKRKEGYYWCKYNKNPNEWHIWLWDETRNGFDDMTGDIISESDFDEINEKQIKRE